MEEDFIKEIERKLNKMENLQSDKKEALIHALVDIKISIETVYDEILPKLVNEELSSKEIQDLLWDVREEFRHIDYHIHDSEIIDL